MADITTIISSYGGSDGHNHNGNELNPRWSGSPEGSVYTTSRQSITTMPVAAKRKFKSYRLRGEYEKPWLTDPALKRTRMNNYIVMAWVILGFIGAGLICYFSYAQYQTGPMCMVFEDDFNTLDETIWSHEVTLNGFGTGSFDWTTTDSKNSYVDGDGLHIVPTLTNETTSISADQLYQGYTLNLTKDGSCTGNSAVECSAVSDPKKGSMIPPVRSARLTTKGTQTLKYGRVEVVAKMPRGDWIWPAIWMMPQDSAYGVWPRSGEIDIMESRGNGYDYLPGGRDYYYGSLHWGPSSATDAYWRTTSAKALKRGDFSTSFHTFGLEWDEKYIYFYLDNRLTQILFVGFSQKEDLWKKGEFARMEENSTLFKNPWSSSTTGNAPFDQPFYLILNVAVGSRMGWFPDNLGSKPWLDAATNAQWTFWSAADKWLPTWGEGDQRGMTVRSVKMWRKGAC
ncbi:concanavalin A-like lectin/glucanase domain-containing protein [Bombardia bombarda]|uniref:Concanavalin A-like lectin/glucanase domain-containing protein n=1 Tax=Bombardia bombarda TaxID=252184 RepID=A0AA39XLH4_9PEZI|nr:concanavalin A-like lectin/glucanase domain-containing protein [Bombardia bombarda]